MEELPEILKRENLGRCEKALCLLVSSIESSKAKDIDAIFQILYQGEFENQERVDARCLLRYLLRLENAQITDVASLTEVLYALRPFVLNRSGEYYDEYFDVSGNLSLVNGKYALKGPIRLRGLSVITDTDFIDECTTDDAYQILYGPLYYATDFEVIYNFIVELSNTATSPILKRAWIEYLVRLVNITISRLMEIRSANTEGVKVIIPFLDGWFEYTITDTLEIYQFVLSVLQQIHDSDAPVPFENSLEEGDAVEKYYPIPRMEELMEKFLDEMIEADDAWANYIYDEMTRRGFHFNEKVVGNETENNYRSVILGIKEKREENTQVIETVEDKKKSSLLRQVGVYYYLLQDSKADDATLHRVCSFALRDSQEYKGLKPDDTIYTYIKHPWRFIEKYDNECHIREKLAKYGYSDETIDRMIDKTPSEPEKQRI